MSGPGRRIPIGPPAGRAAIARRLRAALGPPPRLEAWPPVSLIVVNRDGEEHLRRLLPLLASATEYPALELILVDNASEDGSVELARSAPLPFPLTIVENEENLSFSEANDDGADRAAFDRLLFLNNDVEPFEPGWLKELVACLERSGAPAVGATLLHGGQDAARHGGRYVVQHRRVELAAAAGFVKIVNAGDGEELAPPLEDVAAVACTAACMLARRDAFERVGGFTPGYLWGWEDVDFGLKLASGGDALLCSGRSVLFHSESSTRSLASREWQRSTRSHNRRLFAQRWGPQLRREYLLDRMDEVGLWTDGRPPLLAVVGDRKATDLAARELADAVEAEGWRVVTVSPSGEGRAEPPDDADFALVTDPSQGASLHPAMPCVAWVHERTEAWLGAPLLRRTELTLVSSLATAPALEAAGIAPVLFSGAADAQRLQRLLRERVQRLSFCLKLSRDGRLEPAALALRRSLEAREHVCMLQLADEWEAVGGMTADVAVVCGDPGAYCTNPAQLNVLWAAAGIGVTECDQWDLVLVADEEEASSLGTETPTLVTPLDLNATADPADALLEPIARAAARDGIRSSIFAQA